MNGTPYAFVRASDGHLWVNWWDGASWQWSDQGTPPGRTVDPDTIATVSYQGNPYVFLRASDVGGIA